MVQLSSSCFRLKTDNRLKEYDYETLFRSPEGPITMISSMEPPPMSLNRDGCHSEKVKKKETKAGNLVTSDRSDTRDAALLLASIKKLDVKETLVGCDMSTSRPPSRLVSSLSTSFRKRNDNNTVTYTVSNTKETRTRAVSLDNQHLVSTFLDGNEHCLSFSKDALPKEKITLDLTSNQEDVLDCTRNITLPARISPPSSPMLTFVGSTSLKGPRGVVRKNQRIQCDTKNDNIEEKSSSVSSSPLKRSKGALRNKRLLESSTNMVEEEGKNKKNKQERTRPSILNSKSDKIQHHDSSNRKVLRKKFSWKNYPELEDFLIANREEYLRHSAMNYTMQQKEYNNRLTERLLQLASDCGYIFDEECFSFVSVRDRIRCYFKSYVQSKKKRGMIVGYAARKKGLITEEDLEKSAGIKGTIVVPKKKQTDPA